MRRGRPRRGCVPFAVAGLAAALVASCGERGRPAAHAPPPAAPASTSAADAAPAHRPVIPAVFQGEWNLRLEDCGGLQNDGRLVIAARALEFHESQGDVVSAGVEGDILTVRAAMSGEGETWEETYRFQLAPNGQALRQRISQADEGVQRLRCPGAAPP